ncbi:MAG: roadblock/LC7 domain-containing protein [Candidatus Njordarchaeales archaeon]
MLTLRLQSIYKNITKSLNEILALDENIIAAIISNLSGMLIAYAARENYQEKVLKVSGLIEGLAATLAAIYGAASVAGNDTKLSKTRIILIEYEKGNLIICNIGKNSVLAIITNENATLGVIRMIAKRYSEKIEPLLSELDELIDKEIIATETRREIGRELNEM